MDNNKIVDNLNFIKIYFRVFIHKIVVLEKAWIIQKRDKKNQWLRMKTRLCARIRSKNPKRRVQNAPKYERMFSVQEPIRHFWSAKRHFKRAEFPPFGLWPNALWVMIRHTLFDLYAKGWVSIHILHIRAIFLESSGLYK